MQHTLSYTNLARECEGKNKREAKNKWNKKFSPVLYEDFAGGANFWSSKRKTESDPNHKIQNEKVVERSSSPLLLWASSEQMHLAPNTLYIAYMSRKQIKV